MGQRQFWMPILKLLANYFASSGEHNTVDVVGLDIYVPSLAVKTTIQTIDLKLLP